MIEIERRRGAQPPMETIDSRDDEVLVFDVLPHAYTDGTSYDYYRNYPRMDEELYYLLECATLNNADPEEIIKICKEVQQERNKILLDRFENKLNPNEVEIDLDCDELNYNTINDNTSPDLPEQ